MMTLKFYPQSSYSGVHQAQVGYTTGIPHISILVGAHSLVFLIGKTTLARIIANMTGSVIKELSATSSGAADVRAVFEEAKNLLQLSGKKTVLFIGEWSGFWPRACKVSNLVHQDEIQRFNKAQQV